MSRLIPIQALRAVAATAVVACHFNQVETMLTGRAGQPFPLYFLSSGVDLFFVISGFIMVLSAGHLFATPKASLIFAAKRIARIAPIYWIITVVAAFAMEIPVTWPIALTTSLFIPFPDTHGAVSPINGVGWTLNFEMFFYFLFALALFLPRRIGLFALIGGLIAIVVSGILFHPKSVQLSYWSDPIILEFGMGICLALIFKAGLVLPIWLRAPAAVIAIVCIWLTDQHQPPSNLRYLLWGLPAAVIVAAAILGERREMTGPVARAIDLIGDSSYALYLFHPIISAIVFRTWIGGLNVFPIFKVLWIAGIVAGIAAMLIRMFVEKPLYSIIQTRILKALAPPRLARVTPEPVLSQQQL